MVKFFSGMVVASLRLLVISLMVLGVSWYMKKQLPKPAEIDRRLRKEPVQQMTKRQKFSFRYAGKDYDVTPVAEYEIYGLVVTHNDINSMGDIYHDSSSVDIKDLGLIWGSNILGDDYRKVKYWSNCYTVNWRYGTGVVFSDSEICNVHLLSSSSQIREAIKNAKVGDQVFLKGMLVNYREQGANVYRKSSTSRTDVGMGACEVMFVEESRILHEGQPIWRIVFDIAFFAGCFSLGAMIFFFVCQEQAERRFRGRKHKENGDGIT